MTEKLKISIVTPNLNCAPYLAKAIESVRNQSYPLVEHIVIDGGSTDGSLKILEQYSDLVWISEPDQGMNDAVNKGFKIATGDILCYLNSDDYYLPGALEAVAGFFSANSEVDLVVGDFWVCDDDGRILFRRKVAPLDFRELLFGGAHICQPAVFWRRSLYERVGELDISLDYAADHDYFYRMGLAGARVGLVKQSLAVFRLRVQANTLYQHVDPNANLKFQYKHWRPLFRNERANRRVLRMLRSYYRTRHYLRRFFTRGYLVFVSGNVHIARRYKQQVKNIAT